MQKLFRSLLAIGALAGLAACGDDVTVTPPPPPDIVISGAPVTAVAVGAKIQLQSNVAATWTSSNAAVASVDATGLVTAVAAGTASITATSSADATKKASVTITVTAPATQVRSVTVSPNSATINPGQTLQLVANVDADAGVARTVTWASSNSAVATVSTAGVVTAVTAGAASITAASTAAPSVIGAAAITVAALAPITVSIKSVTYNVGNLLTPVDFDNVFGQVDITLNVDPGGGVLQKVSVLVDNVECASQSFGSVQAEESLVDAVQEIVLSCNTAAFDNTTGVTRFKNGPRSITAKAEARVGTVIGSASVGATMIFRNVSGFMGTIVTANGSTATDQAGFQWKSGDLTINAVSVLFGDVNAPFTVPTVATANVTFGGVCEPSGGRTRALTLTGGTWSATFLSTVSSGAAANNVTNYEFRPAGTPGVCAALLALGEVPIVNAVGGDGNGIGLVGLGGFLNNPNLAAVGGPRPDSRFAIRLDNFAPTRPTVGTVNPSNCSTFLNTNTTRPVVRTQNWTNDALVLNSTTGDGETNAPACTPTRTVAHASVGSILWPAPGSNGNVDAAPPPAPAATLMRRAPLTQAFDLGSSRLDAAAAITYEVRVGADATAAAAAAAVTSVAGLAESALPNNYIMLARAKDLVGNSAAPSTTTGGTGNQAFAVDRTAPGLAVAGSGPFTAAAPWVNIASGANPATFLSTFVAFAATDAASAGATPSGFFSLAGNPLTTSIRRQTPDGLTRWWCTTSNTFVSTTAGCTLWVTGQSFLGPLTQTFGAFPAPQLEGYYQVVSLVEDQAGNQSPTSTSEMLYDVTVPAIGGISFPAFLSGGDNVTFSSQANDNVDLGTATMLLQYPALAQQLQFPTVTLGTFGSDVFTLTSAVSLQTQFIRSLQVAAGGTAPGAGFAPPNQVTALVNDVAQNPSPATNAAIVGTSIPVGTAAAAPSTVWNAAGAFTWNVTQYNAVALPTAVNVNRDLTPAATGNVTSVAVTACAVGPASTFQNPFTSRVEFWVQAAAGTWRKIGSSTSPSVTDNGVTRSWCFTSTWDPEAAYTAPFANPSTTAVNVIAIGVNNIPAQQTPAGTLPAGDGLATPTVGGISVVVP